MKPVQTQDDSTTFYNQDFDEHYHSLTGAKEEAIKKYVEPCKIVGRGSVVILDFCFGLGYNTAAAIDAAGTDTKIVVYALEKDVEILRQIGKIDYPFKCRSLMMNAVLKGYAREGDAEVHVRVGDAAETVKHVPAEIDVVFFDPFSPKKCPSLWTVDVFKDVYSKMKPGGILATYSCARAVRDAMKEAGFRVEDGPIVRRWAPGTLGIKD